jgi:hypothetical protein
LRRLDFVIRAGSVEFIIISNVYTDRHHHQQDQIRVKTSGPSHGREQVHPAHLKNSLMRIKKKKDSRLNQDWRRLRILSLLQFSWEPLVRVLGSLIRVSGS